MLICRPLMLWHWFRRNWTLLWRGESKKDFTLRRCVQTFDPPCTFSLPCTGWGEIHALLLLFFSVKAISPYPVHPFTGRSAFTKLPVSFKMNFSMLTCNLNGFLARVSLSFMSNSLYREYGGKLIGLLLRESEDLLQDQIFFRVAIFLTVPISRHLLFWSLY